MGYFNLPDIRQRDGTQSVKEAFLELVRDNFLMQVLDGPADVTAGRSVVN